MVHIFCASIICYGSLLFSLASMAREERGKADKGVCRFRLPSFSASAASIISLSGPGTQLIYHLNLLSSPHLKAISIFNGFSQQEFSGDLLQGGIFLSTKYLQKYKNPVVFFDYERQLQKVLHQLLQAGVIDRLIEVKTIKKDPFEVYAQTQKIFLPYTVGCQSVNSKLDRRVEKIRDQLKSKKPLVIPVLFYLGGVHLGHELPQMIMVKDGPVLFLQKMNKIKTYPYSYPYILWSSKEVAKLQGKGWLLQVGLVAESDLKSKSKKRGVDDYFFEVFKDEKSRRLIVNVHNLSLLIPGISQILFLEKFWTKLEEINRDYFPLFRKSKK